jgi:SAM-dependent methyltransferase/protein-tyrosine-phosphatase
VEAYSSGTNPHGLNRLAVRAMAEAGVDISGHTSKRPEDIGVAFDVVVTVCDSAHESCPVMPGARIVHVGFDDPPRLARGAATDDEAMPHYRRVRDEIRAFVETLPGSVMVGARSGTADVAAEEELRRQVRDGYAAIAKGGGWSVFQSAVGGAGGASGAAAKPGAKPGAAASACCAGGGCCGPATFTPEQLAAAMGYATGEIAGLPEGANMGLSCGNPTALASLRAGEVVLDLGAGGGFDCFIAGGKVGSAGRVIGVDMTPDMVAKARANIASYEARTGLTNVEFRLGEIENLPVADRSVDVVISNCVLNLAPDKARVWREIARVLKPGGRVAVSDLALLKPLPEVVRRDVEALVGCVAGAVLVEETRRQMRDAGLVDVVLTPKPEYIAAMTDWNDPLYRRIVEALPRGTTAGDYITSLDISGRAGVGVGVGVGGGVGR